MKRDVHHAAERSTRGWLLLAVALGASSCDRGRASTSAALPPGVVARVGSVDIRGALVARIAAEQHVSPARARDMAVGDALLTQAAISRGLDASQDVRLSIAGELARRMGRRILADAGATPPTEDELRAALARRWLDVDRPEGFRVVHAVARYNRTTVDPATKQQARAVMEAILAAVVPVSEGAGELPLPEGAPLPVMRQHPSDDPDPLSAAFRKAAFAVPHPGIEVLVEPLPAVAADARVLSPGGQRFDPEFARAASSLASRGALSPLFESSFGMHVVMLLERTPAHVLEGEARFARLRDDIVNERARAADKKLLAALRVEASVSPQAPGLLDLVVVEP